MFLLRQRKAFLLCGSCARQEVWHHAFRVQLTKGWEYHLWSLLRDTDRGLEMLDAKGLGSEKSILVKV